MIELEKIAEFLYEVDKYFPIPLSEKRNLDELALKFFEKGTVCAEYDNFGKVVAMVAGYTDNVEGDKGYISVLATLPSARGKGFAQKVVKDFFGIARAKGLTAVHLYTHSSNIAAINLYKKIGFTEWLLKDEPRFDDIHFVYYF